jgi:hypothetical protein
MSEDKKLKWNEYMRNYRATKETKKNAIADQAHTNWSIAAKKVEKLGIGKVATDKNEIKAMKELYKTVSKINDLIGKKKFSVDHVVEISLGGDHTLDNLQILPISENIKKAHRNRKAKSIRPKNDGEMTLR